MKRSCRIVVSEGDNPKDVKEVRDKKIKQLRSPEERNKKRQTRLETQGNPEAKYCECGEMDPKHGYYIKADDMTIYTRCLGSRAQTELMAGYALITIEEQLKTQKDHLNATKFRSGYESENTSEGRQASASETAEKMEKQRLKKTH
ncbi:hypothetical protein JTB14_026447 [Gonioctena quinquepunctata]|nr:hypothetical protein JTB14_026447 [Gonioctena quinquepunctata]